MNSLLYLNTFNIFINVYIYKYTKIYSYILDINILWDTLVANIFSCSIGSLSLCYFFATQKFLTLMLSYLSIFAFAVSVLDVIYKNLANINVIEPFSMVSCMSSIILGLTYLSL